MKHNYGAFEEKVISLFPAGTEVLIDGIKYQVILSGKPRTRGKGGEPKTDCYIKFQENNTENILEYKISCKLKDSNEFQENKISNHRAEEILGPDWSQIITQTAQKLEEEFQKIDLYNPSGTARVKQGHIILGWKIEIASKKRTLSAPLEMSDEQIREYIYKGVNQDSSKRNAFVNDIRITDSGIANHILISTPDEINSPEDVINNIVKIDNYNKLPQHYLIFTSNSYRVLSGKTDGNRYLAVRIEWEVDPSGKMIKNIKFNSPLVSPSRSKDMREKVDIIFNDHPEIKCEFKK